MKINKLKVTFYNQIKSLFILIIISSLFFTFLFFYRTIIDYKLFVVFLLFYILIIIVPVIIIHLNYYIFSKSAYFEITDNKFIIVKNGKSESHSKDDVVKIVFYMTANKLKDSGFSNLPFEYYYYCKMILSNGDEFIITCLHSDKLDEVLTFNFSKLEIEKVRTFFPIIVS
jgi:hypothetical protein